MSILFNSILPIFAEDARDMVQRIMQGAKDRGEEIELQDGFDLYKELSEVRRVYMESLPGYDCFWPLCYRVQHYTDTFNHASDPFPFQLEDHLSGFVWRWIQTTSEKLPDWVEQAVKQDAFSVRTESPNDIPTEEQRHSVSVLDIFRSFNQVVDQVVQLNWDDDVGYAKFMTAVSKSVGDGLGRYCEILERTFSKEMDRLSPEQEASASQSRQEKWMQMAKEAWNSKEKIEPFQFFPEVRSCSAGGCAVLHWLTLHPSRAVLCQAQ